MWARCRSIVLLAVALAPGTALAGPAVGPSPDQLRDTLRRPRLEHCDELVCYYRPPRHYSVRGLRCEPAEQRRVVCSYERIAYDLGDVTVTVTATPSVTSAPAEPWPWTSAETKLEPLGEHWIVIADSDD